MTCGMQFCNSNRVRYSDHWKMPLCSGCLAAMDEEELAVEMRRTWEWVEHYVRSSRRLHFLMNVQERWSETLCQTK